MKTRYVRCRSGSGLFSNLDQCENEATYRWSDENEAVFCRKHAITRSHKNDPHGLVMVKKEVK